MFIYVYTPYRYEADDDDDGQSRDLPDRDDVILEKNVCLLTSWTGAALSIMARFPC
jgi:hypothetical protein